jgi:hypothetical protein
MKTKKLSGPAVFMYSAIALTLIVAIISFALYYLGRYDNDIVLWMGIISFMIFYHFGLRIFMGEMTKKLTISYTHPWYKQRKFEKKLYRLLRVRSWKDKVLTFEPDKYDFQNRTLEELATTMAKSELDHWINEVISITSVFFAFIWGVFPAFIITAILAMLFDAQFIVVQRYNRPIVLRLIGRKNKEFATTI